MTYTKENNRKLFEYVYDAVVYGSGGDGEAIIQFKSQDLEVVVLEFEKFLKEKEPDSVWDWDKEHFNLYGTHCFRQHYEAFYLCNRTYEFSNGDYEISIRTW